MLDDFNREELGIEVDFSLPALRVTRTWNRIIEWRGKPKMIRVDKDEGRPWPQWGRESARNEYVSATPQTWAKGRGMTTQYIQPFVGKTVHWTVF